MKEHKGVTAALRAAETEHRCAIGDGGALYYALRRRLVAGELVSPYPNLFADDEYWAALNPEQKSLHVIRALSRLHPNWVFAGLSAACVYGYQHSFSLHDGSVSIASVNGEGHGDAQRLRRIYMHRIPWQRYRGIAVTSPARVLIDCSTLPFPYALGIFDSALRAGHVSALDIETMLVQTNCEESAVKKLLNHADPLRENGGESWVYGHIVELGYAAPSAQVAFRNPNNPDMPYRVDFCWKLADGRVIVAEYDGMAKYADAGNLRRASLQAKLDYERSRERHLKSQGVTTIVHLFFEDVRQLTRLDAKLVASGVPKIR